MSAEDERMKRIGERVRRYRKNARNPNARLIEADIGSNAGQAARDRDYLWRALRYYGALSMAAEQTDAQHENRRPEPEGTGPLRGSKTSES